MNKYKLILLTLMIIMVAAFFSYNYGRYVGVLDSLAIETAGRKLCAKSIINIAEKSSEKNATLRGLAISHIEVYISLIESATDNKKRLSYFYFLTHPLEPSFISISESSNNDFFDYDLNLELEKIKKNSPKNNF